MNPEPQPQPQPPVSYHPTFRTRDIWQAAYAMCFGSRLLRTILNTEDTGVSWELDNTDPPDGAWKNAMDFRHGGDAAVVPIQRFRSYYRVCSKAATEARQNGVSYAPAPAPTPRIA